MVEEFMKKKKKRRKKARHPIRFPQEKNQFMSRVTAKRRVTDGLTADILDTLLIRNTARRKKNESGKELMNGRKRGSQRMKK